MKIKSTKRALFITTFHVLFLFVLLVPFGCDDSENPQGTMLVNGTKYTLTVAAIYPALNPTLNHTNQNLFETEVVLQGAAYTSVHIIFMTTTQTLKSGTYVFTNKTFKPYDLDANEVLYCSISYGRPDLFMSADSESEGTFVVTIKNGEYKFELEATIDGNTVSASFAGKAHTFSPT